MLTVSGLGLQYGKRVLFDEADLKFTRGNCYGVIGANGAGKSTLLKIIAGEIDATRGHVTLDKGNRMAVLKQNHFEYEEVIVINTVIMGHREMFDLIAAKDAIYNNPDATEEDFLKAAEMETRFGEMGGWSAESDAAELLSNLGIKEDLHYLRLKDLSGSEKVKVLLAQAIYGEPDILLLDEPTNDLDAKTIAWLADFLADFRNTVIVVSHDRYFLDMICTHVVDIDFGQIRIFTGNYTFWYESSQLMARQMATKNKKVEQQRKELQEFIARFSANASKSKQATSRKKALEKLKMEDIRPSSRKYPYINFTPERTPGGQILKVENLGKKNDQGEWLFRNIDFNIAHDDKVAVMGNNTSALTAFFQVLAGEVEPDTGTIFWGQTITNAYLPNENEEYFTGANDMNLMDWLSQYSTDTDDQFIRGFLGRMLFKGEEVFKSASVLSGGEKVRCMLSKVMLKSPNFLLLDEPTNHLDLEAVTALNNGMQDFTGNIMFTSHDYHLMNSVSNRVMELTANGMVDKLMGFDDYIRSEAREVALAAIS
ncbi:MAG TPA: ATP-binding cassette domain-containing protein [Bacteroidetes bacterium]|nr:ATP-binding cassette domain-containing protein [Bacteroidota bacterium]